MSDEQTTERDEEQDEGRDEQEAQEGSGADDGEEARSSGDQDEDSGDSSASGDSSDDDSDDDGDDDGDKTDKQKQDEEIEAAKQEVKDLEDDPPQDLEDWPSGKAKYETFGGAEGDHGYHEGPEENLGPSSLRHTEDGGVTVEGEEVDDPEEHKGEPIPGGPTDPDTPNLRQDKADPEDSSQNPDEGDGDSDSDDDSDSGSDDSSSDSDDDSSEGPDDEGGDSGEESKDDG